MKRELGIGRCGLACCLCSENAHCKGCQSGQCSGVSWCENYRCSLEKGFSHCFRCLAENTCKKGLLAKMKPAGFNLFIQRYGLTALLDCLEANEKKGIVYHRTGFVGDYDGFEDIEALVLFIRTGKR